MEAGGLLSSGALAMAPNLVLGAMVLFCRIGACLMLTPGFSSGQIPTQVRLFIALGVTFSLAPALLDPTTLAALDRSPVAMLEIIAFELLTGAWIGLLARLFFVALETLAYGAATMLGMANPFGVEVEPNQMLPPLATLITFAATALIFFTRLDVEILRGLAASYRVMPIGTPFNAPFALRNIVDLMDGTFHVALRICSPFIIYAMAVNIAIAVINRLAPQIAIFYISTPFIIAGGLLLLYLIIKAQLGQFTMQFGAWLSSG